MFDEAVEQLRGNAALAIVGIYGERVEIEFALGSLVVHIGVVHLPVGHGSLLKSAAQTVQILAVVSHNGTCYGCMLQVVWTGLFVDSHKGVAPAVLRVVHKHESEHCVVEIFERVPGSYQKLAAVVGHSRNDEPRDVGGMRWIGW